MVARLLRAALRLGLLTVKASIVLVCALAIALIAVCQPWPSATDGDAYLSRVSQYDLQLEREVSRRLGLADQPATGLWQLRAVRAQEAWAVIRERYAGQELPRTKIGVYDGFMSTNHPDLATNILPEAPREDWSRVDLKALPGLSHGTGVMGIIGAAGGRGMHGTAPRAALLPYTTRSSELGGSMTAALGFFATQGARVVNFAIAVPSALAEQRTVDEAHDAGVLIVTGLYNADTDGVAYPAAHLRTITVSGSGPDDRAMGFGWGPLVDVVAPGTGILTTGMVWRAGPIVFGARYLPLCCNSAACAIVTGIGGLILEHDPSLTSAQLEKRIKVSARKLPEMGGELWHPRYGYGVADAYGAVTHDKRGPKIQSLAVGHAAVHGLATDDVEYVGLDPSRPRDSHLWGIPTSNVGRVEFHYGDQEWRPIHILERQSDGYDTSFALPIEQGAREVKVRAWDTAGNVGTEETLRLPER